MVPTCGDLDARGNVVVGPNGDALCDIYAPIDPCVYQRSIGVTIQSSIDAARRLIHELGFRPYRVYLVWTRRDRRQIFQEFRRKELMPVTVSPLDAVDRELRQIGLDEVGSIRLTRVSPNQTTDYELRGQIIQGQDLGPDEQFFYEVVRIPRFAGETPERERFNIGSVPYYNAVKFEWELEIHSQHANRSPEGQDQTFEPLTPPRKGRLQVLRR